MRMNLGRQILLLAAVLCFAASAWCGDDIPKAAWQRPMGLPVTDAGTKKPTLDAGHIDDGFWQGAPVGGFGAGTFSRTYRGDFARWHLKPGIDKYQTVYANQFSMFQQEEGSPSGNARVLFTDHPRSGELSGWKWDYPVGAGNYYSLYPRSWFDYHSPEFPAHVVVEQFSPVLPNNYRESSYPVAVYRWSADNPTNKTITVSVMLSWTNMLGWFRTYSRDLSMSLSQGDFNHSQNESLGSGNTMKGIVFDRHRAGDAKNEWDGQFAIAAIESPGVEVTYHTTFSPDGPGTNVWAPFSKDGRLSNSDASWTSGGEFERLAGAIAVRFTLKPGERKVVPMVISWDMPVVQFGSGRNWYRRYTDFYGTNGQNAWAIARDGLLNSDKWRDEIEAWQNPYVSDESKPLWYRGMLFNELYTLTDGGSVWGRPVGSDPGAPPSFAFMECFDYPYYNTLDVLFYGSVPLLKFWPEIDKQVLRQFADVVPREYSDQQTWVWKMVHTRAMAFKMRKAKGALPHDSGSPYEDPFYLPNAYNWQDSNGWKDLNPKFVLMVYRDYALTGGKDEKFLRDTWPAVKEAMAYLQQFDGDSGIPENGGYPDQTYDEWVVSGVSAYTGGLWLGALRASEEMAKAAGDNTSAAQYHQQFDKAQKGYIAKLWNGEYFNYDTGDQFKTNVQADMLAGQWYAGMTGLGDLVPREMQMKSLKKIFDFNVMKFGGGNFGAVNGIAADGTLLTSNEQVQEVWTGTTFSVAALMLDDGMKDEAYRTAWGLYHVSYETKGYWFRTPEAWDVHGNYRASMYMRPAAIWALEMTPPAHTATAVAAKAPEK
ncbi:MAG: non-lysosomal glucosylceramidase [Candidatus Acidiferrales bacterium]